MGQQRLIIWFLKVEAQGLRETSMVSSLAVAVMVVALIELLSENVDLLA